MLIVENPTSHPKTLLKIIDHIPDAFGKPAEKVVELIQPQETYTWIYTTEARQRGIYHWSDVDLLTATPLGLFWSRRHRQVKATAVIYPLVLPLKRCFLLDTLGEEDSDQFPQEKRFQAATVGLTRGLRPYRRGDSPRLIHWRSSARYGELRVRELELALGGQDIVICLSSAIAWDEQVFEDAVIAAASLYFYARRSQLNVQLWTAGTGLIQSQQEVLEVLAAVQFQETQHHDLPSLPLIWLTSNPNEAKALPPGSRWLYFSPEETNAPVTSNFSGLTINTTEPLQQQLQKRQEKSY